MRFDGFLLMAAAAFLALGLLAAPAGAQIEAYKQQSATAKLGEAEIDLFGPADFQRVDGLAYDIDERLAVFHPKTSDTLAIFAEPGAWQSFFDVIFSNSPRDLAFYATIATAPATGEFEVVGLNPEDISALLKLQELSGDEDLDFPLETGVTTVTPLEPLSQGPRHLTFKSFLVDASAAAEGGPLDKRYLAVISAIEVEGQMLFLNLFANRRGPQDERLEQLAADWRDDYLARTKSLTRGE